jgi:hypothetical protein
MSRVSRGFCRVLVWGWIELVMAFPNLCAELERDEIMSHCVWRLCQINEARAPSISDRPCSKCSHSNYCSLCLWRHYQKTNGPILSSWSENRQLSIPSSRKNRITWRFLARRSWISIYFHQPHLPSKFLAVASLYIQSVKRRDTGWTARVQFQTRETNFSLLHSVQTGFWAHSTPYPMDTEGSFPGGKAAGAWSWPLTSS